MANRDATMIASGPGAGERTAADTERAVRGAVGWALLALRVINGLGFAWDVRWHVLVGRDRFLTPPHILLYSGTALTGLVCTALVLWDTRAYRLGRGVDDDNSIRVLGLFHAPLGAVVAGCGALVTALAAPFDNYWHELYGIDVTLWAPFHVMGLIGGTTQALGTVYFLGSLLADARRSGNERRVALHTYGVLIAVAFLMWSLVEIARPAIAEHPLLHVGPVFVVTFSVLLALFVPWTLVASAGVIGSASAAVVPTVMAVAYVAATELFVPWAVRVGAVAEGFGLRSAGTPQFQPAIFGLAVGIALATWCVSVDVRGGWPIGVRHAGCFGASLGFVLCLLGLVFVMWSAAPPRDGFALASLTIGNPHPTAPHAWLTFAITAALAVAAGASSGWIGNGLGTLLRLNRR